MHTTNILYRSHTAIYMTIAVCAQEDCIYLRVTSMYEHRTRSYRSVRQCCMFIRRINALSLLIVIC